MKNIFFLLLPILLVACSGQETAKTDEETTNESIETGTDVIEENVERKSPRQEASGEIYGLTIAIDYGSPRVKGREIWGELVPYNEIWRAGADEVTAVTFDKAAMIDGNQVDPGTYGLFIIPKKDEPWTLVLNEEWSQDEHGVWGAYDYKEDKDVLRVDIEPQWQQESKEEMTFSISEAEGAIVFEWENAMLVIPVGPIVPA
ncbi:MAG: DUF2911 domain-containing protein [Crocinitomicaceae bacterium]|nr:DUF2911 domain-containing protein [Crocinitomicaceae bacterium]